MNFGGRPVFGLGDAAGDVDTCRSAVAAYGQKLTPADQALAGQTFDLAVQYYRAAGVYAMTEVLPRLQSTGAELGVPSGPLAADFAAAADFATLDNSALQSLAYSTDPAQFVATPDTAMGARSLAQGVRSQLTAMLGILLGAPVPGAAPAPPTRSSVPSASWAPLALFALAIAGAFVIDRAVLHRRPSHA